MIAVAAAILGALAAGLLQTVISVIDRKREKEATIVAIASEVKAICDLVRLQRYLPYVSEQLDASAAAEWEIATIVIDIRSNYFSVFESLSHNLGKLEPPQAAKIVSFYCYCKSAIDSAYPDGVMIDNADRDLAVENLRTLKKLLDDLLRLGDEIIQLPNTSLTKALERDQHGE
jgi:type II secretory pathway pseudopilin PulG